MKEIQFNDLGAQYMALKSEIDAGIAEVIAGAHFISGPQVAELEERLCEYVGCRYCVSTSNGTDALRMPLMVWGVGPGDAVFVPSFTFYATAEVVSLQGATPIFCDVLEDSFNLDPASLREQLARVKKEGILKPRAVIPVDLFGQAADYPEITAICDENGLLLLEDAAQGFGGCIGAKKACSFGDAAATSFFPAKALGCYGDGGAIFTDDKELYELLISLRVHGKGEFKYDNVRVGLNARLDTLQAAILLPKLRAFDAETARRRQAAARYAQRLPAAFVPPVVKAGHVHGFGYYTLRAKDNAAREAALKALAAAGVPGMVYYPKPLHLQTVCKPLGYAKGDLPVSERLCETVFSLPMHGYITDEEIDYICAALADL